MPLTPKSAPPHCSKIFALPALQQAADGGTTLFTAPAGYLPTDGLAAAAGSGERPLIWLRHDTEDRDPAVLAISLIAAMQRLRAGAGTATLDHMRRQPGPVAGWPPIFAYLSQELAESLGSGGVLVLENCHYLGDASATLRLLGAHVLSALPAGVTCILSAERSLPPAVLPAHTAYRGIGDLRVGLKTALSVAEQMGGLSSACIREAIAVAEGRAVALAGLLVASEVLGPAPIQRAVDRSAKLGDLLARIAHAWLVTSQAGGQTALAVALRLGYAQPALMQAALGSTALTSGPWLEQLDNDWFHVLSLWKEPLRAALHNQDKAERRVLPGAARYLIGQGAIEQAVGLYFELGDRASAAQAIASIADNLMTLGQWETLEEWLSQLPAQMLEEWPSLVYTGGELAAAQRQLTAAQRAFELASSLFMARHDAERACQSLLAESTVAEWAGDHSRAEARALAAHTLVDDAGMPWYKSWTGWQLGCLSVAADNLDAALVYFTGAEEAAAAVGDALMLELPRQAERLTLYQRELRQRREFHRQAYFSAEQAEQEAADQLRMLLSAPPVGLDALLDSHGWARLPLMLKLPAPDPRHQIEAAALYPNVWNKLLGWLGLHHQPYETPRALHVEPRPDHHARMHTTIYAASSVISAIAAPPIPEPISQTLVARAPEAETTRVAATLVPARPDSGIALELGRAIDASPRGAAVAEAAPALTVYMLGPFRASLNDRAIDNWPSGRGRAVFKYLLTQRHRPVPRDMLMDVFWPEAGPEAARNNLHVALHGLRQALREVDTTPVVIFENGAYRLNPDLAVWLDVEEFERHYKTAGRLEAAGQLTGAIAEYEAAISLYQDDFFVDDPYEEWPVLTRERLRVTFLEALDRLSQIYFAQGQYGACASLCQRVVEHDSCREDAHCRLMRCYSRQGQPPLALRQFQLCAEALRSELDVEPSPATIELYERIRRREPV